MYYIKPMKVAKLHKYDVEIWQVIPIRTLNLPRLWQIKISPHFEKNPVQKEILQEISPDSYEESPRIPVRVLFLFPVHSSAFR